MDYLEVGSGYWLHYCNILICTYIIYIHKIFITCCFYNLLLDFDFSRLVILKCLVIIDYLLGVIKIIEKKKFIKHLNVETYCIYLDIEIPTYYYIRL